MRKIIVYVEGLSDQFAMEELLESLLVNLEKQGVRVQFVPAGNKDRLMVQIPRKAANILLYDPYATVVALPDLYPPDVRFSHRTLAELRQVLTAEFMRWVHRKGQDDNRLTDRFKVFCFKHDLEALVLAAEKPLAERLGVPSVPCSWMKPVEDQNHNNPPKCIVEALFQEYGEHYKDTIDAPLILGSAYYPEIVAACPQCFQLFVEFLSTCPGNDTRC